MIGEGTRAKTVRVKVIGKYKKGEVPTLLVTPLMTGRFTTYEIAYPSMESMKELKYNHFVDVPVEKLGGVTVVRAKRVPKVDGGAAETLGDVFSDEDGGEAVVTKIDPDAHLGATEEVL